MQQFRICVKFWVFFLIVFNTIRAENNNNNASFTDTTTLSHSSYLDADDSYYIQWGFDEVNITFEVHVKTLGYIGLGFSSNGGMPGSDIIIGWVEDTTGQPRLTDRFAQFRAEPQIDEVQNYELLHGYQNDSHTVLRFRRPLALCNPDDRSIRGETIRLIWSYSATDPSDDGRALYHGANRGAKSMYLLDPVRQASLPPKGSIYVDFLHTAAELPARETLYLCRSFRVPNLTRKHHIIQVEPMIEPGHESLVHHIIMYGCYLPVSQDSFSIEHECHSANTPGDWFGCTAIMFGWAIGGGTFTLPEEAGVPIGQSGDPTMIIMETHYDNPQLRQGLVDSSGLRLTLTPTLRANDAGIIQMGNYVSNTQIIPPFAEDFRTHGYCLSECLSQAMTDTQVDHVTLFGGLLHAHIAATAISLRHFRHGIELEPILEDLNYDFNFQEARILKKEVLLKRGDYTITECHYRSTERSNITRGGLGTRSEMCQAYVFYYPQIPVTTCSSAIRSSYLGKFIGVEVSDFGVVRAPAEYAGANLLELVDSLMDWKNKTIRDALQHITTKTNETAFREACYGGTFAHPNNFKPTRSPQNLWERPSYYGQDCYVSRALTICSQLYIILAVTFLSNFLKNF